MKKRIIEARVALELRKAVKHSNPPGIQGAIEAAVREKVDSVEIQAARKYMCVYSLSNHCGWFERILVPPTCGNVDCQVGVAGCSSRKFKMPARNWRMR